MIPISEIMNTCDWYRAHRKIEENALQAREEEAYMWNEQQLKACTHIHDDGPHTQLEGETNVLSAERTDRTHQKYTRR